MITFAYYHNGGPFAKARMKRICISTLGWSTNMFLAHVNIISDEKSVEKHLFSVTRSHFKIFFLWFSSLYCTPHIFFSFLPNTQRSAFCISIFIMHKLASKHTFWGKKRKLGSEDVWVLLTSNRHNIYHFHSDFFIFSSKETICRNDFWDECKTAHINISYT